MTRIPTVWIAVLGVAIFACGGDRARKGGVSGDTIGALPESRAPAPMDTMGRDTTAASTADNTGAMPRPEAEMNQQPATPNPSAPPTPPGDTSRIKPNIDPKRVTEAPKVPRQAAVPAKPVQDTSHKPPGQDTPFRDQYHQAPKDTVSQTVYNGWKQYNLNCARCHGEDVLGTTIAPHLIVSLKPDGPINTKELFEKTVCDGRPEKGMPAWCPLGLDKEKIDQIYAYVKGRSDAKIGPGRPAVQP